MKALQLLELREMNRFHHRLGLYKCGCGRVWVTQVRCVMNGDTKSCGCLRNRLVGERSLKHGHAQNNVISPTYISWQHMKTRCNKTNHVNYQHYGGRGIKVCKRWNKFENFLKDMGKRPKHRTLDRINNDGNYEPGNCRWATSSQQASNCRARRQKRRTCAPEGSEATHA